MARRFGLGVVAAFLILGLWQPGALAAEPPGDWPPDGTSTYEGTWTVVDLVSDASVPVAQYDVGEILPGSVEIECAGPQPARCEFRSTFVRFGATMDKWAGTLERAPDGTFRSVEEESQETGCGGTGLVQRTEIVAAFDGPTAAVTAAELHVPRTHVNDGCTAYATDEHWRFDGETDRDVPSASGASSARGAAELERFLTGYGLDCAEPAATDRTCRMERPDALYAVAMRVDAAGTVTGVDASVTSFDPSMPSDAGGFLRGVAERAPIPGTDALLAWFDGAISGGAPTYAGDGWTATWSATEAGDGTEWALRLAAEDPGAPEAPQPSVEATPGPTDGVAVPLPSVDPGVGGDADGGGGFARSIPPPTAISTDPTIVLQSAILAALLVFLMPFPGQLFNSTLETHEAEVRRWLRLDRLGGGARGLGAIFGSWPGVAVFTALAALLYGFLDPGFGLDLGSLATFLGMLLGIVLVTVAFAIPTVLAHRRLGDRPIPSVVPVSLLVGVVCVLISRLTDFQPGYLYGLLIGFAFARELSAADTGRATAIGAGLMLGLAFVAWLALGALPEGDDFGVVVARTTLAALMVAGLEGVVFGLLPMRFLPGEAVYGWNRPLWAGLLLVGAFAFFHILINPASGYLSDTSRTPLMTVIALLLGFSLVSVAFWAWFRYRTPPDGTSPSRRAEMP